MLDATLANGFFSEFWLRKPSATESGRETDAMFMWLWWFCVVWFVFLMALMVFWVVKYRRRPGKIAQVSPSHNTPLEIAWTVIPSLFLIYIFFRGFWGYIDKIVSPGDAIEMQVVGFKWGWQLNYPNGAETPTTKVMGAKEVPVFYMPAKTPVRLRMQSRDVMHAFFVPDFRIKQDVLPNRYMTVWFNPDGPDASDPNVDRHPTVEELKGRGMTDEQLKKRPDLVALAGSPYTEHYVFCAEYCGTEHSEMSGYIRVVPDDVFNAWHNAIGTPADPIALGQQVWKTKCASCHTINGAPNTGPTWLNTFGSMETLTDGTQVVVDEAYILESIFDPSKKIVKGYEGQNMSSFRGLLTPAQVDGVIQFMKSISTNTPAGTNPNVPQPPPEPQLPPGPQEAPQTAPQDN